MGRFRHLAPRRGQEQAPCNRARCNQAPCNRAGRCAHRRGFLQVHVLHRRHRAARPGDPGDREPGGGGHSDLRVPGRGRLRAPATRWRWPSTGRLGSHLSLPVRRFRGLEAPRPARHSGDQPDQPLRSQRGRVAPLALGAVEIRRHLPGGRPRAGGLDRSDRDRQPGEGHRLRDRPDHRRAPSDRVAGRARGAACSPLCGAPAETEFREATGARVLQLSAR